MHLCPRLKVCCIASVQEATLAVRYGASAVGLVSAMPSGPGPISEDRIAQIAATVPPPIATFLLTCLQDADRIIEQQQRCGTNTIQLCDRLTRGSYQRMRQAMPGVRIVQVIHVMGAESIEDALSIEDQVDAILLDSGNPTLAIKELGGTGRRHDWAISRQIRERLRIPIFLAGGLHAQNVAQAIEQVNPFGLDVCSGVRTAGALDEEKLRSFLAAAGSLG